MQISDKKQKVIDYQRSQWFKDAHFICPNVHPPDRFCTNCFLTVEALEHAYELGYQKAVEDSKLPKLALLGLEAK